MLNQYGWRIIAAYTTW